jgi:uncharacterized LabA/DUF88 family protein
MRRPDETVAHTGPRSAAQRSRHTGRATGSGSRAPGSAPPQQAESGVAARVREERIGVFIDGLSLQVAANLLQMNVDFKRLLLLFQQQGRLVRANYYAVVPGAQVEYPLRPLLDWLSYNGFSVVSRSSHYTEDAANMLALAVDISVDAMLLAEHLDHVVLFSACRELQSLVRALKAKGVVVSVVSTTRAQSVSDELRRQADFFVELEELRPVLTGER